MPIHVYKNWNVRPTDSEEEIEPYRKYFFICEGANTETFYFEKLIDIKKQLGIHQLIDLRLLEKTDEDKNLSFPKLLVEFAEKQKEILGEEFDKDRDKMVIVFDADVYEKRNAGYDELVKMASEENILGITNPGFELFLLLHIDNSYEKYIKGCEEDFLKTDEKDRYSYAYNLLRDITNMNAKKNRRIGELAENVYEAIRQEKYINQDIFSAKGKVTSNIGVIIEQIINEDVVVDR